METTLVRKEMSRRILSEILNEPDAYFLLQEVHDILDKERARREQFYNDITEQEKVEFINGEIIVHSPVSKKHNEASGRLYRLLSHYVEKYDLGFVGIEKVMISLTRNDYEPDICLFREEKSVLFDENQTLFPAPDFVVEVLSDSTQARDRGVKFQDYQAHGIEEYWIIDAARQTLEQYHLRNKVYELILNASHGIVQSFVLDGFQIPVEAIFNKKETLKAFENL